MPERILVLRTDRLGDVILSLPIAGALKHHDPRTHVCYGVGHYPAPVLSVAKDVDEVLRFSENNRDAWVQHMTAGDFTAAVFAFPRPDLALAARRAGIPVRVGTGYRWYSYRFTHRHFEHRKHAEFHEAQYNAHLLEQLGIFVDEPPFPRLRIDDQLRGRARAILRDTGMTSERFVVLHPGSGKSAPAWNAKSFRNLAALIARRIPGVRIVVTGAHREEALMREVAAGAPGSAIPLIPQVDLVTLAAVFEQASVFISNSTGPLHLAAAAGTAVVGIYPGLAGVTGARRWAPLTRRARIVYPHSGDIPAEDVYEAMHVLLDGTEKPFDPYHPGNGITGE
ncbi:MAG: glycosyltransferase family 9 protein [Chlorobi bacterium]|nr:glycosyltransferase family 9 protein [Chlorobiota bacterium]